MSDIAEGIGYFPVSSRGRAATQIEIVKVDNGFIVQLQEHPLQAPISPMNMPNPFEGMSEEEIIDKMIDGIGAVFRTMNDKGAGENWKSDEDRGMVREAFKVLFPGLTRSLIRRENPPKVPKYENRVFESKETLISYLTENL